MTQFLIPPPPGDPSQPQVTEERQPDTLPIVEQRYQYEQPVSTRNRFLPIVLLLLVLGGVGAWFTVRSAGAGAWHDDVYAALDLAEQDGRPVFVLFTADWCPPCRQLKADTLSHDQVLAELDRFVLVKVDLTDKAGENGSVAAELDVSSIPAMHVYDADGNRLASRPGYIDPASALAWLQDARAARH